MGLFGGDYDEYDTVCDNCGRGYNFEVGFGGSVCPHCGHVPGSKPQVSDDDPSDDD